MATPTHAHLALHNERQRALEESSKLVACDFATAARGYEELTQVPGESVTVLTGALVLAALSSQDPDADPDTLLWMAQDAIQMAREKLAEKLARSVG